MTDDTARAVTVMTFLTSAEPFHSLYALFFPLFPCPFQHFLLLFLYPRNLQFHQPPIPYHSVRLTTQYTLLAMRTLLSGTTRDYNDDDDDDVLSNVDDKLSIAGVDVGAARWRPRFSRKATRHHPLDHPSNPHDVVRGVREGASRPIAPVGSPGMSVPGRESRARPPRKIRDSRLSISVNTPGIDPSCRRCLGCFVPCQVSVPSLVDARMCAPLV